MPQITQPREVLPENVHRGLLLILWGFFKKVVIADNLGPIVDQAFASPSALSASEAMIGVYAFAWQIYCDFSGYSDIARGTSALMGIHLMVNFRTPYFSKSISEFWRRWHISLSSWLTDYVYFPLGGSRRGRRCTHRNLWITMLLSGLWHGAAWTFIARGALHAGALSTSREFRERKLGYSGILSCVFVFHVVCFGWIFFRASNFSVAFQYLSAFTVWETPAVPHWKFGLIALVAGYEAIQQWYDDEYFVHRFPGPVRFGFYVLSYASIMLIGNWSSSQFIYFQF